MTEKEFKQEYMGMCVSDEEVIEYLEKENAKLKEQIEKMKNCNNCRYNVSSKKQNLCACSYCCNDCSKWELAE